VKLGGSSFTIEAGHKQKVSVKLRAQGFQLLVRLKRMSTLARISYSQPESRTTVSARLMTITAPKSVKR
jgi:hypothetical protein